MHADLEILLQIQDLKAQRRELTDDAMARVQREEFRIDPESAGEAIAEKIEVLESELSDSVRSRYQRIAGAQPRAVVPVINGTCYGCFVSVPTARWSDLARNRDLHFCENCGRFLYSTS